MSRAPIQATCKTLIPANPLCDFCARILPAAWAQIVFSKWKLATAKRLHVFPRGKWQTERRSNCQFFWCLLRAVLCLIWLAITWTYCRLTRWKLGSKHCNYWRWVDFNLHLCRLESDFFVKNDVDLDATLKFTKSIKICSMRNTSDASLLNGDSTVAFTTNCGVKKVLLAHSQSNLVVA